LPRHFRITPDKTVVAMRAPGFLAATMGGRPRWQTALAGVLCLATPLASWVVDGRGRFAFTMYAATITYRVEITQVDPVGRRTSLDPTDVAADVSSFAAPYLVGMSVFRTVSQVDALRAHLGDVARAACRTRDGSTIEVALVERPAPRSSEPLESDSGPTTRTSERVACPRAE
jgi:hypothetical protein